MPTTPTLSLHFRVFPDDALFTAVCTEFPGLITCAETMERLRLPMIRDAVIGWFDALKAAGRLDSELQRLGIEHVGDSIRFRPVIEKESASIEYSLKAC